MTDRRFDRELSGWTYCYGQEKLNGKHHIADRRGRAYMCPCGRKWALQVRLGILPRYRHGFARVRR